MGGNDQLQDAAVLVPVFRRDERIMMLIVRRTDFGVHGGQLAFPGGKPHDGDSTMLDTALREAGVGRRIVHRVGDVLVAIRAQPVLLPQIRHAGVDGVVGGAGGYTDQD